METHKQNDSQTTQRNNSISPRNATIVNSIMQDLYRNGENSSIAASENVRSKATKNYSPSKKTNSTNKTHATKMSKSLNTQNGSPRKKKTPSKNSATQGTFEKIGPSSYFDVRVD